MVVAVQAGSHQTSSNPTRGGGDDNQTRGHPNRDPPLAIPSQRTAPATGNGMRTGAVLLGSLTIPGRPENVAAARAFATWTLGEGGACTDIAVLLTSELVTNSLRHGGSCRDGGSVTVTLIAIPGGIRAEVTDEGGPTVPTLHDGHGGQPDLAEGGRGLQLVEVLSARWGYFRDGTGTMTWFELMEPHE